MPRRVKSGQRDTHPQEALEARLLACLLQSSAEGAPAAEQRANTLRANTIANLEWLDSVASFIPQYRDTPMYTEATRRAGSKRGTPGLTEAELALRAQWRRAQANVRQGIWLAERWNKKAAPSGACTKSKVSAATAASECQRSGAALRRSEQTKRCRTAAEHAIASHAALLQSMPS